MNVGNKWWLAAAAGLGLAVGGGFWALGASWQHAMTARINVPKPAAPQTVALPNGAKAHVFDRNSVYSFLAAAKRAEANGDALQRCLAYPDPPGSHWSPAAVAAYCRYRTAPLMSVEQVRGLLEQGQYAELDRRMAGMLDDKLHKPDVAGVMDHAFESWFNRSDLDLRPLLEHWKQASPHSAFAYTASGVSYVAMAWHARGEKYIQDTPRSNIEAMDRFLALADADLQRAAKLDPRMTPAYVAMIDAGQLSLGTDYVRGAAEAGLRVDPANFAIYNELMRALQPRWGGSIEQMKQNGQTALMHASDNPLLMLLPEKAVAEEVDLAGDNCKVPGRFEQFSLVFDQVAVASQLSTAAESAEECNHLELSAVYYSEELRFYPEDSNARAHRVYNLNEFDESAWAVAEATRLMHEEPGNADYVASRGNAYEMLNDYPHAEQDYLATLALSPNHSQAVVALANLYLNLTHDWDKAWALDERIVQAAPAEPYGWWLRGEIQIRQPRKGLKETADYFAAHFDTTPDLHRTLLRMRAAQALQEGAAAKASAKAGASQHHASLQ
jgi:tetratricopeptide (TPR) repeat protein